MTIYPFPVEDAKRSDCQHMQIEMTKNIAKESLLEQIRYNEMKRKIQKNTDLIMGQKMIQRAIENLNGEDIFKKIKQRKATELMRKQWEDTIQNKKNIKEANKIFE